ncbi:MAG: hypothetical protein KGQ75_13205 [Sphingomonadales bacterium]|nr:hypothetical protein [Sphingomonadales bacterium]
MRQGHVLRVTIVAIAFGAALTASLNEAIGEEVGGLLTGTFTTANHIGSLALIAGGVLLFFRAGLAFFSFCLGAAFVLPMQSWRLFPGIWCTAPGLPVCSGSHRAVELNGFAVMAISLAIVACILSRRIRTP